MPGENTSIHLGSPGSLRGLLFLEEFGVDFFVPRVEVLAHGGHPIRMLVGEIDFFTEVMGEVEEVDASVFVTFDQFEVSGADGASGEASLV